MLRTSAPLIGALDCIATPTSGKANGELAMDFIKLPVASGHGVTGPERKYTLEFAGGVRVVEARRCCLGSEPK